jgi:K+-transporting ATPase ATPase C chain
MTSALRISLLSFIFFTILTGLAYPGLVTVITQGLFHQQTQGSLIVTPDGKIKGSELIGQNFTDPRYFWGRPSATAPAYNAAASSGSNLGVNAESLAQAVKDRIANLKSADPDNNLPIPVDLVTASGSGLDPHISPAAAIYQIERVARNRKIPVDTVKKLVAQATEDRQWGILGEPRVNVLKLNLALDAASPRQ